MYCYCRLLVTLTLADEGTEERQGRIAGHELRSIQQQGDYDYYPVLHFLKGNGDVPRLLVVIDIISSV